MGTVFQQHYYLILEAILAGLVIWLALRRKRTKRKILIAEDAEDSQSSRRRI
jgi:hypothetical protein